MRVKWRLFRQEAGRDLGGPPVVYILLFVACIAAGNWTDAKFGSVAFWPTNGVLLAAILQLHRRRLLPVLAACFAINVACNWLRHDPPRMLVLNAVLNMGEALLAGFLARRLCGAALDMRRPLRLALFAVCSVLPAVCLSAIIALTARPTPLAEFAESFQNYVSVETLGILITTPALLLIMRWRRFGVQDSAPMWEKIGLMLLLAGVTAAVFSQAEAPVMFLVFLPLLLIAFRLSPPWAALAVILVAFIAGGLSLDGYGPATLSSLGPHAWPRPRELQFLRIAPVFHMFLAAVVVVTLPASMVLTERRRLDAKLRARTEAAIKARALAEQAAEAKSRFLSMMSHEMRTPLNGVAGFAEMLASSPELGPAAQRQVEQIRLSSDGLLMLVDDILDFSRGGEDLAPEPFCVASVVEDATARAAASVASKDLTVAVDGDLDRRVRHLGDARRVRQVLQHLLSNAVKFTAHGSVTVGLRVDDVGFTVVVSDTGPGLSEPVLADLFKPFVQADASTGRAHEGVGMGLALSCRLVELMGGTITGANRPEGGAVFVLHLPLPRLEDAPAVDAAAESAPSAPRVLVVDDHPMNREVAALMLVASGCDVSTAEDGHQAVAAVSAERFDLVLMDVRMPGMDGLEATRAIRALPTSASLTPIVAMTADAMPEDVARCRAAGMAAHLAKPVSRAALNAMLVQILEGPETGGEAFTSHARAG
jgi:signal transduction histidine kinase/CheY-like chemotaxis protein